MTQIIIVIGRKGGITKSTVAANFAAGLARKRKPNRELNSVVIVEGDGQGSLARMMGVPSRDAFYELVANGAEWQDVLQPVPASFAGEGLNLALLPSSDNQLAIENTDWVGDAIYERFQELRGVVDYVVVDTSPNINEANSAWFYVADWLLLPTLCERPSIDMLRYKTFAYIENAQKAGREAGVRVAEVLAILPNRFDNRKDTSRVNHEFVQTLYGRKYNVMPPMRDLAAWNRASQYKLSIYTFGQHPDATDHERRQSKTASREIDRVIELALGIMHPAEEVV